MAAAPATSSHRNRVCGMVSLQSSLHLDAAAGSGAGITTKMSL